MTRINYGIHPTELSDKHLLAEHREIKRIPNVIASGKAILSDIPEDYCLGKGHVKFFYNKMNYLFTRYVEIYRECLNRKFNITCYFSAFEESIFRAPQCWERPTSQDLPSITDRRITLNRLLEKNPEFYKALIPNDTMLLF